MRTVFVLLSILLVAACASGNGSPSKDGSPASLVARAPSMTDDEVADYVADLATERLEALCGQHRSVTAQLECARDAIFRGFDKTGEARRHCDADAAFKDTLRCVVMGSLGYELARAAQIPADDYNWADPSAGLKEAASALSRIHLQECVQGPISAADGCIVERLGRTLTLPDQQVTTCTDKASLNNSVRCLLRSHLIQEFESAVARMGPGEIQV
jgi:hypothetical protein